MNVELEYKDEGQYYPYDLDDDIDTIILEINKKYSNCKTLSEYIIQQLLCLKEKLYLDDGKETIDNCLNIMIHFKWSDDLLFQSNFFENDEIRVNLYQDGILFQYQVQTEQKKCDKCEKNVNLYQIGCNHYYCLNCYDQHIVHSLDDAQSPQVKCLSKECQIIIPYQLIIKLSNEVQAQFRKLLCKSFLANNNNYTVCFTNECQNINKKSEFIYCLECQQQYCLKCKQYSHFPLSCDKAKVWLKKADQIESYTKGQSSYQFCYNCMEPCEVNNMQQYMINCQCGVDFCSKCGYYHEQFFELYQIDCQFIQESALENLVCIHNVSLYKFKKNQEKLEKLKQKIKLLYNQLDQFQEIQKFKVALPDISSSFKTILELCHIILYMIPHFEYYNTEKWEKMLKTQNVNIEYYNKCIQDQQWNYDLYLTLLDNNNDQLNMDSEIYDEFINIINKINNIDQQLILEINQLVQEIRQNE